MCLYPFADTQVGRHGKPPENKFLHQAKICGIMIKRRKPVILILQS